LEPPASFGDLKGDASWLAAPFVEAMERSTVVFHQVRNPREVIRSLLGVGMFATGRPGGLVHRLTDGVEHARRVTRLGVTRGFDGGSRPHRRVIRSDFTRFVRTHLPEAFRFDGEMDRCTAYWIGWNAMIERSAVRSQVPYFRYRIEDVGVPLVSRLLDMVGETRPDDLIRRAMEQLPKTINRRERGPEIPIDSLRALNSRHGLAAAAERYGYVLPA
jgi:hypothetical protein